MGRRRDRVLETGGMARIGKEQNHTKKSGSWSYLLKELAIKGAFSSFYLHVFRAVQQIPAVADS